MAEREFPANNSAAKKARTNSETPKPDERKKLEPVVKGEVSRRKRPLSRRFSETFVQGDAQSVWSYILLDVLVPTTKNMIADAIQGGVDRAIFGEARPGNTRNRATHGNPVVVRTDYAGVTRNRPGSPEPQRQQMSRLGRSLHNFDEVVFQTRVEAEEVLDMMYEQISIYGQVTLGEFYDLVNLESTFADEKYGWDQLQGVGARRTSNGYYVLNLPRPMALG